MGIDVYSIFISTVADVILGKSFERLLSKGKKALNRKGLRKEVESYCQTQFAAIFEKADLNCEIDYQGLKDFIIQTGTEQIIQFVTAQNPEAVEHLHESFLQQSYATAHADTRDAKETTEFFVNNVINIVREYYIKQNDPALLALHSYSNGQIVQKLSASKEQIIEALNSGFARATTPVTFYPFESDIDEIVNHGIHRYIIPYENSQDFTWVISNGNVRFSLINTCLMQKHVIILGEAGAGKTYALKQLCGDAKEQGFVPVFLALKNYPMNESLNKLLDPDIAIPDNHIFILDGYDEITPDCINNFIKHLNGQKQRFSDIPIVMTSRYNFYRIQDAQYAPLEDFSAYVLIPISSEDKETYAKQEGVDFGSFAKEMQDKSLGEFASNPFYFTELIHLWIKEQRLPERLNLMKAIIHKRIREDIAKFFDQNIDEKIGEALQALRQTAIVLQCIHRVEISDLEYQQMFLFLPELREILKHIGLWQRNSKNEWGFAHNNFREYFAADYLNTLSFDVILDFITMSHDRSIIRLSWLNTLAFLMLIRSQTTDLLDWIEANNPSLVVRFEKDRFTKADRIDVFKCIINHHEDSGTWLHYDIVPIRELAAFSECRETVQFILDCLGKQQTTRHQLNLLFILKEFHDLHGLENETRSTCLCIVDKQSTLCYVHAEVIRSMAVYGFFDLDDVQKLVDLFQHSDDIDILAALYNYVIRSKRGNRFISAFIWGLENVNTRQHKSLEFINNLYEGLRCADTIESIELVLRAYLSNPRKIDNEESTQVYKESCKKAAAFYNSSNKSLMNCFYESLIVFCQHHIVDGTHAIKDFMQATHTEEQFISTILRNQDEVNRHLITEDLMSIQLAEFLIEGYRKGDVRCKDFVNWFISRLIGKEAWWQIFDTAVVEVTGSHIQINKNYSYQMVAKEKHQRFFDSLFSQDEFDCISQELLEKIDQNCTIAGLPKAGGNIYYYPDLHDCSIALYSWYFKNPNIKVIDYKEGLNWDVFSHENILQQMENKDVEVTQDQIEQLKHWCLPLIEGIKPENVAHEEGNQTKYAPKLLIVLRIMEKLTIQCTTAQFKSMLLIPSGIFQLSTQGFPAYLTENIVPEQLKEQVVINVETLSLHGSVASNHFEYCTENHIVQAKKLAVERILDASENEYTKRCAIVYLYRVFGADCIYEYILPRCDSIQMLEVVTDIISVSEYNEELDIKIQAAYHEAGEDAKRWMVLLIKRSDRQAIIEYYENAKAQMKIPDLQNGNGICDITEALSSVNDFKLLNELYKLLSLSNDEGFRDQEILGLRHSVIKAIENIAIPEYERVIVFLAEKQNEEAAGSTLHTLIIDMIESIKSKYSVYSDKPISFIEALGKIQQT